MNNKKFFLVFLVKTAVLTFFCIGLYFLGAQIRGGGIEKKIIAVAKEKTVQINHKMNTLLQELRLRAQNSRYFISMRKLLEESSTRAEFLKNRRYSDVVAELKTMTKETPLFAMTMLASKRANIFITDSGEVSSPDWKFQDIPYLYELEESFDAVVSNPHVLPVTQHTGVVFYNPLRDSNDTLLGVFAFDIDITYLNSFIDSLYTNEYSIMLVSSGGEILADKDKNNIFTNVKDLNVFKNYTKKLSAQKNGVFFGVLNDGTSVVISIEETGIEGWNLIVTVPRSIYIKEVFAQIHWINLLSTAILVLLYLLGVIWFFFSYQSKLNAHKHIYFDSSARMFSRTGFLDEFNSAKIKQRQYAQIAVFLRIKKMVVLNEKLGNQIGKALVDYQAQCIGEFVDKGELCGHFDGSNYGMLLKFNTEQEIIERLKSLSQKIKNFAPLIENNYSITLAFGCYIMYGFPEEVDLIERHLGLVLTTAANENSINDTFRFFNDEYKKNLLREKEMLDSAEAALENKEFVFYLQGKYLPNGELCSAESLVRWNKNGTIIQPDSFVPLFEKNGIVTKLDFYVLDQVCAQLRQWLNQGKNAVPIAVNFSRVHLLSENLAKEIIAVIDKHSVPHNLLEIEITESALGNDSDYLIAVIKELDAAGIRTSIDDFGTGYSTLSTLKDLLVTTLKIDREFFLDMEENERAKAVINTILSMSKELGIKTVAEGIETIEQVDFLKSKNVDYIQGFFFGKPVPVEEFEKLLK